MKGLDVKKKLQQSGYQLKDIAELIGETPQNLNSMLNAQDIKTGVIERIAKAIKKNLYFFYEDTMYLDFPYKEEILPSNCDKCKILAAKDEVIASKDEVIKAQQQTIDALLRKSK